MGVEAVSHGGLPTRTIRDTRDDTSDVRVILGGGDSRHVMRINEGDGVRAGSGRGKGVHATRSPQLPRSSPTHRGLQKQ